MWNEFSKTKPTEDGWYICTVQYKEKYRQIMSLYWYSHSKSFNDNDTMMTTYNLLDILKYNCDRVDFGMAFDRTEDVVAWMKMPEPFMDGFELDERYNG